MYFLVSLYLFRNFRIRTEKKMQDASDITKIKIVNMFKKQLFHLDENCQLKSTHGSSMNDEENLPSKGRLYVTKQHYTKVHRKVSPIHFSNIKIYSKSNRNKKYSGTKFLTWDLRQKCVGIKLLL